MFKQGIIFDIAGTVVDFGSRAPVLAMKELFSKHADTHVVEEVLRRPMGKPKREHIADVCKEVGISDKRVDELYTVFKPMQVEWAARRNQWVDEGVPIMLQALLRSDVKLAFTTGYNREMTEPFAKKLADVLGSKAHGVPIITADDVKRGRPWPDMCLVAASKMELMPFNCTKVGDTVADMQEGRAAGMQETVGVAATGNEVGVDERTWYCWSAEKRLEAFNRAAERLEKAGAQVVLPKVTDLLTMKLALGFTNH